MRRAANILGLCAAACFGLGFLGGLHPALDALAIGRWVALWSALGLFLLAALWQARIGLAAGLAVGCAAALFAPHVGSAPAPGNAKTLRLYSKNLLYTNANQDAVAQDILAAAPDLVFLQEVSRRSGSILQTLEAAFPHRSLCPLEGWNSMAILSKTPFVASPACSPLRSLMAVELDTDHGRIWAVNVHLQHPWPDYQWAHLGMALPVLSGIDPAKDKVVMAGDFNTMPWTAAPRAIGRRTRTKPLRPAHATFHLWGAGLPLDQVWAASGTVIRRPKFGSDHHGLLADLGFDD